MAENNPANESTNESERQRDPTAEQTEVDREQYNQSGPARTEPRPESDVQVEIARGDISISDRRKISIEGTVTNMSSGAIDIVDIEIVYLDADGRQVGAKLVTVQDLSAGETTQFTVQTESFDLQGDPVEIEHYVFPQDRVS